MPAARCRTISKLICIHFETYILYGWIEQTNTPKKKKTERTRCAVSFLCESEGILTYKDSTVFQYIYWIDTILFYSILCECEFVVSVFAVWHQNPMHHIIFLLPLVCGKQSVFVRLCLWSLFLAVNSALSSPKIDWCWASNSIPNQLIDANINHLQWKPLTDNNTLNRIK